MPEQLQEYLKPVGPKLGKCIIRNELEVQLIKKSWRDDQFRQALLQDPKTTIQAALGTEVLDGVEVQVFQETPDQVYLVLPMSPASVGGEMSDEELASIAVSMWT